MKLVSVFRDTLLELEDGNINMIMTAQVREEAEVLIHGAIVVQELEAERQTSPEQEPAVEKIQKSVMVSLGQAKHGSACYVILFEKKR